MLPERKDQPETSPATDRLVGVRGPKAAQRARALHLAVLADETPAGSDGDVAVIERPAAVADASVDEIPAAEPPADPAVARRTPAADVSAPNEAAGGPAKSKGRRKRVLLGAVAAIVVAAGGWFGVHYVTVGRYMVSTDDAYVHADATTLAAKVAGYVSSIDVPDNSFVRAGDIVARIDDGDYRLALEAARGKVETQRATVARIGEQIPAAQAQVEQARAQLVSAQAAATRADSELARQVALAQRDFASRQTLEQATANRDQAAAAVQAAHAAIDAAVANVAVLHAQQQEAERTLEELKTAEAKAARDLSFTIVRAPIDGVIGNRAIKVGDFVQTGTRVAAIVPLDDVYIDANFKETQLARLRPGQPVEVSVDALPDRDFKGTVASVSPASGSVFSLLPPDNATGNFTKIVQRLPVRIHLPDAVTAQRLLRPGMSVVVSVNTKPTAAGNGPALSFAAQAAGRAAVR
jgi:membrane fusion protein (multidrug efflux system)